MYLSKWLAAKGWSAGDLAKEYAKRYPKAESISRQLMLQYVNGHPMPGKDIRARFEKMSGGEVKEVDWDRLAKALGKIKVKDGKWRRPDGLGDKRKKTRKPAAPAKGKRPASPGALV